MLSRTEKIMVLLITLIALGLVLACVKEGQSWGDDFALYIEQTQALANHSVQTLYLQNKYSMDNSVIEIGPYLYPFGFSLLMLPLYFLVGINFTAMQLFCGLFFVASIPFIYLLFKPLLKYKASALFLTAFIAFHHEYIIFVSNVIADLPFAFFCLLSLYFMRQSKTLWHQMVLGILVYYSYFIKDAGLALLPALFVFQFHQSKNMGVQNTLLFRLIPYLIFGVGFLLTRVLLPNGSQNQYTVLVNHLSYAGVVFNASFYSGLIVNFIFQTQLPVWCSLLVLVFILFGAWLSVKSSPHLLVFSMVLCLFVIVWPGLGGLRYLFSMLPIVVFFLLVSLEQLATKIQNFKRAYGIFLVAAFSLYSIQTLNTIYMFSKQPINESQTTHMQHMYTFIKQQVDEDSLVVFFKPRALRLFTQRNSVYMDVETFRKSELNYILLEKEEFMQLKIPLVPMFESGLYVLLKKY